MGGEIIYGGEKLETTGTGHVTDGIAKLGEIWLVRADSSAV